MMRELARGVLSGLVAAAVLMTAIGVVLAVLFASGWMAP